MVRTATRHLNVFINRRKKRSKISFNEIPFFSLFKHAVGRPLLFLSIYLHVSTLVYVHMSFKVRLIQTSIDSVTKHMYLARYEQLIIIFSQSHPSSPLALFVLFSFKRRRQG